MRIHSIITMHINRTVISQQILHSAWGADAQHIWACGVQGNILFYDGSAWDIETDINIGILTSIHGYNPYRVWAGGDNGEIYFGCEEGFMKLLGDTLNFFDVTDGLVGNVVYSIFEDKNGTLQGFFFLLDVYVHIR